MDIPQRITAINPTVITGMRAMKDNTTKATITIKQVIMIMASGIASMVSSICRIITQPTNV